MASIVVTGDTSGSVTIAAPAVASTPTLTLPTVSGTFITTASSGQSIPKAALPTGSVLQVVQAIKTDTFSTNSTSFTDVTGLSVSITPTSSSSKILILSTTAVSGFSEAYQLTLRLVKDSTAIFAGDSSGSRSLGFYGADGSVFGSNVVLPQTIVYLDSPATTSSTTYKIQGKVSTEWTWYVNRSVTDSNATSSTRTSSSIIVMEIAA